MTKLKFTTAIAAATLAVTGVAAGAAQAQPWRDYERHEEYRGGNLTSSYVDSLEWRINNAAREGRIPWGQARQLQRELRAVQPLAWRVETGQASRYEYQRLSSTVNRIEAATNNYPRYSYNNRWR
ncbi:hypothetical protein ACO2Q0_09660 [Phenylobacterium sp. VNQ135]|uniref:hypothetical protein n=1 Tax=Phenylobacterium sp. VNQ135 TaxID=3400922 RepID=UPI003C0FD373